jgi:propionyl-CoA carboxylase alpha chain
MNGVSSSSMETPFHYRNKEDYRYGLLHPHRYFSTVDPSLPSTTTPPFSKVLIANRGEISQRIMKTCRTLGIQTVAIFSTADAKAPFVQQADEAICVGPAASSQSYLNVEKVLDAIRATGAEAVHPGYGFLSENSDFCHSIQNDAGAAWVGPPVSAIQDMGDKIRSKEIAEQAGATIVPGYDGAIESIDHAVQVARDVVGYPVLLKAAAGGGGKGMRTCRTDQQVREAYPMAKAEAKNFFKDDRLLIEKYIDNPHHIEFQVLCGYPASSSSTKPNKEDLQVVVFPERECSIQRRNQKIIEESPSCLLTEETRKKMVEEVKKLCKTVGYVSAGTVEFLVDENQNFYFLEMNTRLQVEHPITEAITGVDLVKGMLWVAAGWGLPPEFQPGLDNYIMPHIGHALEARIYAEDPTRGYLPSTGPLLPYIEPPNSSLKVAADATAASIPLEKRIPSYLRMDSGVTQGHVVSPYYDPMLSKIVSYGQTRQEAIDGMLRGLDQYVIEGVQHNARLVNAVLRHDAFRQGNTPTSFLGRHIPNFEGVQLTNTEEQELAVAAAVIGNARTSLLDLPPLTGTTADDAAVIVRFNGMFGSAFRVVFQDGKNATVQRLSSNTDEATQEDETRTVAIESFHYEPERYIADVTLDGVPRFLQVLTEDVTGEFKVQMYGADLTVLLQSPREYELSQHMKPPQVVDTSEFVMSPMPGTLIRYAIKEGDTVELGQELCIVEAMKMQNVIRSPRAGVIKKCHVDAGSSLMADEIIVEFDESAKDES